MAGPAQRAGRPLSLWWRRGRALNLDAEPLVGGDRVRALAGVQDRLLGELDPVDHPGRVEDLDVIAGLRVGDELGELEPAGGDQGALVGPDRGRVVERILPTAHLEQQLEGDGTVRQPLLELGAEIVASA